ncbi:VanZ family protein [Aliikangiella sp. G2MR2-5]|uniref:VanZ family protein n=1 Tax=Aliikangiella sp. G2MR2-5 TaxID=2788943 RepID=UPI0018AA470A
MLKFIVEPRNYEFFWRPLFCGISIALLSLTLSPKVVSPVSLNNIDKIYHLVAFASFSGSFRLAFSSLKIFYLITLSCLFGVMIEIVQHFIPNRSFSLADILADVLGVLLGVLIVKYLSTYKIRDQ